MKWIKVEDQLPERYQWVLCTDGQIVYKKMFEDGIFYDGDTYCYCPVGQVDGITQWTELPKVPKDENEMDSIIEKAIQEIEKNHHKIIDDWCKAYLSQLYEEGIDIKPGCFTLCEQVPTFHKGKDCLVRKYWFEPGTPNFDLDKDENEMD